MHLKKLAIGATVCALLIRSQAYSQSSIAVELNPMAAPVMTVWPSTVYEPVTTSYYYPSTYGYVPAYSSYRHSYPAYYANGYSYQYRGDRVVAPLRFGHPTYRSWTRGRWGW